MTVKLRVKKIMPFREADGKLNPSAEDHREKLWLELEDGQVIIVSRDMIVRE